MPDSAGKQQKKTAGKTKGKWKDNIKTDLGEIRIFEKSIANKGGKNDNNHPQGFAAAAVTVHSL